jgi:hypothetical protein
MPSLDIGGGRVGVSEGAAVVGSTSARWIWIRCVADVVRSIDC